MKRAVDKLWKERGYAKMRPAQRHERLGYKLDLEEALGYIVTSALHMPLLSAEEAADDAALDRLAARQGWRSVVPAAA